MKRSGAHAVTEWFAVISITLFAVISPGPDFAMVTRNSLLISRRAGLLTALGISLGVFVHVAYTLLGVGILIKQSPALFQIMKLLGALYLIWLGTRMVLSRKQPANKGSAPLMTDTSALRMGFLTNALNPKTTIFILSLFLQVVGPSTPLATQLAYGVFISSAHAFWFAIVATFFSTDVVQERIRKTAHWIDRAFGTTLVAFGVALAAASLGR